LSVSRLKKLQIELTNCCNEQCVHCYIPHDNRNDNFDSALLWSILDQCHDMGLERITFSGGEPMLHPDFLSALDRAGWKGFKIKVFSNLTFLNTTIINQFKINNVCEVQTSLYSVEPEIHDAVTNKKGSCDLTKQGIKLLIENGIPVFISCPIMKINKDSYTGVLAYAKMLGIGISPNNIIMAQSDGKRENLQYRLDVDEAVQVIKDILDNDTAYDAERFAPGYYNPDEALPCVQNVCNDAICVNAKAEVIPLPGWHKVLGDLKKQTLRDIWENSPELKRLQNINIKNFPKCANCPDIHFCGMSLENNVNENLSGDPFIIPDSDCKIAKETRMLVHSYWKKKEAV